MEAAESNLPPARLRCPRAPQTSSLWAAPSCWPLPRPTRRCGCGGRRAGRATTPRRTSSGLPGCGALFFHLFPSLPLSFGFSLPISCSLSLACAAACHCPARSACLQVWLAGLRYSVGLTLQSLSAPGALPQRPAPPLAATRAGRPSPRPLSPFGLPHPQRRPAISHSPFLLSLSFHILLPKTPILLLLLCGDQSLAKPLRKILPKILPFPRRSLQRPGRRGGVGVGAPQQ